MIPVVKGYAIQDDAQFRPTGPDEANPPWMAVEIADLADVKSSRPLSESLQS